MEEIETSNQKTTESFNLQPENNEIKNPDVKAVNCERATSEIRVTISVIKEPTENHSATFSQLLQDSSPNDSTTSSQIPWQDKVILFTPLLDKQILLPELSSCLAIQAFLRMCNLGFEVEEKHNAANMSPSKTVPFIKVDKYVVGEVEGIIQFINNKNISLTERLEHDQKINMNAFMTLTNNTMKLVELYACWMHKETYQTITRIRNGCVYPWPLNWIQNAVKRHQVCRHLKSFDWSNKTLSEVQFELDRCCEALTQRLCGKLYFFEGGDTELDACVFGHLFAIINTRLPGNYLSNVVKKYPELIKLTNRIKREYF